MLLIVFTCQDFVFDAFLFLGVKIGMFELLLCGGVSYICTQRLIFGSKIFFDGFLECN